MFHNMLVKFANFCLMQSALMLWVYTVAELASAKNNLKVMAGRQAHSAQVASYSMEHNSHFTYMMKNEKVTPSVTIIM